MGGPAVEASRNRRTIETRIMRNAPDSMLTAFDAPDGSGSTPRRDNTTTSTQALMLLNGQWTLDRARAFSRRLERLSPGSAGHRDHILLAYRLAIVRPPEPGELEQAAAFIEQAGHPARPGRQTSPSGLVDFCHVLFNCNEFFYVD